MKQKKIQRKSHDDGSTSGPEDDDLNDDRLNDADESSNHERDCISPRDAHVTSYQQNLYNSMNKFSASDLCTASTALNNANDCDNDEEIDVVSDEDDGFHGQFR